MRLAISASTLIIAALAIGNTAAAERPPFSSGQGLAMSEQALAALDPTLAGRLACRGLDLDGSTLDARLKLAASVSQQQGLGNGTIGLYDAIPTTDLPLGAIDPQAKRYFDQGIALAYGFNHVGAIRSFKRAQELDPNCAMCWWGEALANGPNINAGMDSEQNRKALAALAKARELAAGGDPSVAALIEAQAARYSADPDADRAALDQAYADAMMAIARARPESNDLAILAAESAMNTVPWDYWTPEGEARPRIGEAVSMIERVMEDDPNHPQASHLYIHLLELPQPERAEAAADRLRDTGPAVLGHLVHMPSHIYYRLGRYADSLEANKAAVEADEAYIRAVGDDGMVRYGYYPHNVHFLLTSAQMMGDVKTVVSQAAKLERVIDTETGRDLPWVQAIYSAPYFAQAQYGSPQAILALTEKSHSLAYVEAMRQYARAVAFAQMGDEESFTAALTALKAAEVDEDVQRMVGLFFPGPDVVRIATHVAEGRMAMNQRDYDAAVSHFERAAEIEATLPYLEPPIWYYPVSQSLGAAHYQAGDYEKAREAFRKALFQAPNNALSLYGVAQTEKKLGNRREAAAADAALAKIWQGADGWLDMGRI